jgi:hypothetical protein
MSNNLRYYQLLQQTEKNPLLSAHLHADQRSVEARFARARADATRRDACEVP